MIKFNIKFMYGDEFAYIYTYTKHACLNRPIGLHRCTKISLDYIAVRLSVLYRKILMIVQRV